MGALITSIVMPLGKHRKSLEELQEITLQYLGSDDYSTDPYVHFSDIVKYGYSTLEEFINTIPINAQTESIASTGINATPVPGMRYVHKTEPWRKGSLVKIVDLQNQNYLAILRMDSSVMEHRNIFTKLFTLISYVMFPPLFLLSTLRQHKIQTDCSKEFECKLEEIALEKIHLLAYLRRTGIENHNNLVKVHIHGIPGQPLPPCPSTHEDKISSNLTPQSITGYDSLKSITPPETKTKSKRRKKRSGNSTENIGVVEKASNLSNSGVHKINANSFDKTESNFPVAGVSQIDLQFEMLSPVGMQRGIEGAHNSCYMDSMLFSMFYTTSIFDFLLIPKPTDSKFMKKTRRLLADRVVTPLREIYFCDYESLWALRQHLSRLNGDLLGAFMDAEQVLYLLFEEVFKVPHFIQYAGVDEDGWGDYMHLMSIDANDPFKVISVQRNLETSFAFNGDIKMASVPDPAFILGMPRSNRELIHYEAVIPNTELVIEHLLHDAECHYCGGNADWEVKNNGFHDGFTNGFTICDACISSRYKDVMGNQSERRIVSRKSMKLIAIVCIRGVHFVAFVRSAGNNNNQGTIKKLDASKTMMGGDSWYFFDSMAGGSSEVKVVPKLEMWLDEMASDPGQFYSKRKIPVLVKRSLTDGHLCIYEPIYYPNRL